MTWLRFSARAIAAVVAFSVVTVGMLVSFAVIALAIDWDIPEAQGELFGPSSVFDRNMTPITRFAAEIEAKPVGLDEISPALRHAIIAVEDHRFYEHEGVDAFSVLRAVVRNLQTGGIAEGGSTLTQQYVKNVYVGSDRTWTRKIREAVVALQIEKERSKDEILEAYLNRVYFGDGAYGAEAAARTYFDKPAAELTVGEAALIAQGVSAPSRLSARVDPAGARLRRDRVVDLMERYGFITPVEATAGRAEPVDVVEKRTPTPPAPHFVEEVRRQVLDEYGPELVYRGGLHIITTLDLERQATLDREVRERLPEDPALDVGTVALDHTNGDILAAYSGRDFEQSQVDLALGRDFGQQTGSAFKPIVLATGLEEGKDLTSTYRAPGAISIGDWRPTGGGCGGRCSLLQATASSVNTVFAQLGRDVGLEDFLTMAQRLGVRSTLDPEFLRLPAALGTADLTPLDMTSAFGTFANQGVACPARTVRDVRNPAGAPLTPPDPRQPTDEQRAAWAQRLVEMGYELDDGDLGRCYRAIAPSVAGKVTQALQAAVATGTGRAADIGRPQAGKTGTTQESKQLWFVGYTPDLTMGVYLGDPHNPRTIAGLPGCSRACFGGNVAAPIWAATAAALLEDVEPTEFPEVPPDERSGAIGQGENRRRLGPPMQTPSPSPEPEPEPEPTTSPTPTPEPRSTPTPRLTPSPEPDPENPYDDDGGGGGLTPPILPP